MILRLASSNYFGFLLAGLIGTLTVLESCCAPWPAGRFLAVLAALGLLWFILPRRSPEKYEGTRANERRLGFAAQPKMHAAWLSVFRSVCTDFLAYVRNPGDLGAVSRLAVVPQFDFETERALLASFVPHLSVLCLRNLVNLQNETRKTNSRLSARGKLHYASGGATHALPYEVPDLVQRLVDELIVQCSAGGIAHARAVPRCGTDLLARSIRQRGVPGASLAVLCEGRLETAVAGVLNLESAVAVTPESLFQLGSVTKSFTATLVMMQVDAGRLSLDDLVVEHLPDFTLADASAVRRITVRELLCHTSGIDGDRLTDTGQSPDAVGRLVNLLGDCTMVHRPGHFFSYCNAGYIILGRILEQLEGGKPWDTILRERLLEPLHLSSAVMFAEDIIGRRVASGYEVGPSGDQHRSTDGFAPRSNGPSGTTLAMSATDLVRFAQFHFDGLAPSGERLLSERSRLLMQELQVPTPFDVHHIGWGLGWMLARDEGSKVFGHDGGWAGQSCYLRLCPDRGFAMALMVNGGFAAGVYQDIGDALLECHAGLAQEILPSAVPTPGSDLVRYAGRYARFGQTIDLAVCDARLVGTLSGEYVDSQSIALAIELCGREQARCTLGNHPEPIGAYFLEFDEAGQPRYLHLTERAFVRVDSRG